MKGWKLNKFGLKWFFCLGNKQVVIDRDTSRVIENVFTKGRQVTVSVLCFCSIGLWQIVKIQECSNSRSSKLSLMLRWGRIRQVWTKIGEVKILHNFTKLFGIRLLYCMFQLENSTTFEWKFGEIKVFNSLTPITIY